MASADSAALAGYLFERVRSDIHFLHSQGLIDNNERDTILSRIDGAAQRSAASNANMSGSVSALTSQFGAASMSGSALPPPPAHAAVSHNAAAPLAAIAAPPPMPARNTYAPPPPPPVQDNREKVKALWAYTGAQADDLTFQKSDIIVITARENEHWYRGHLEHDNSGRTGLFPSNYVEPYRADNLAPYSPAAHSYYAPSTISNDPEKAALQPYQGQPQQQYYGQPQGPPLPQQQYYQPQAASPSEPAKKSKFKMPGSGSGLGNTLAHAGVGGLGFGAGSAVASNLVNAIL